MTTKEATRIQKLMTEATQRAVQNIRNSRTESEAATVGRAAYQTLRTCYQIAKQWLSERESVQIFSVSLDCEIILYEELRKKTGKGIVLDR